MLTPPDAAGVMVSQTAFSPAPTPAVFTSEVRVCVNIAQDGADPDFGEFTFADKSRLMMGEGSDDGSGDASGDEGSDVEADAAAAAAGNTSAK